MAVVKQLEKRRNGKVNRKNKNKLDKGRKKQYYIDEHMNNCSYVWRNEERFE